MGADKDALGLIFSAPTRKPS